MFGLVDFVASLSRAHAHFEIPPPSRTMLARMKLFPDMPYMVCLYPRVGPPTRFHPTTTICTLIALSQPS